MFPRFIQSNNAKHLFAILCLHMVSVIYNLCLRKLFLNENMIRSIHVHGYRLDIGQEGGLDLIEELFEIFLASSFANPKRFACFQIHDTGCVGMSFMDRKFIYREILGLISFLF